MSKTLIAFLFASCASVGFRGMAQTAPKQAAAAPTASRVMVEIQDVDAGHIEILKSKLAELDKDDSVSEIWLRINSHGGEVDAGLELIQSFDHLKKPLTCVADVKAWSMGMSILEGCPTRLMTKRATLMMHEVLVQGVGGNSHELEDNAAATRAFSESLIQLAAGRMKISEAEIREHINGRQWWLDAEVALDVGAIDAIVDPSDIPADLADMPKPAPSLLELLGG